MDSAYNHATHEPNVQKLWESSGAYQPRSDFDGTNFDGANFDSSNINGAKSKETKNYPSTPYPLGVPSDKTKPKKSFSIILPPPNANDPLHVGHAMYTVEDVMVRFHRMLGDDTLWLPGTDHAGIETQYVFEKKLQQQGKSRFNFDRQTLYKMIWDYVQENSGVATKQLKRLGFSLDWSRFTFTLDPKVVDFVIQTFFKLHKDGLIYRDFQLVNYCVKCGTSYSDLEVVYKVQKDPLYYIKYGPFEVATVRPETKFGDVALAVHPKDKRYNKYIGQTVKVTDVLEEIELPVIADDFVDPEFGTGVVKITPAHDPNDFFVGKKHNLAIKQVIDTRGIMMANTGPYAGLNVTEARQKVVADLQAKNLITKIDENYEHSISTCYRCGRVIEPLPLPQFFLRVKDAKINLVKKVEEALDSGETKIMGPGREKILHNWLDNLVDWNISRQIVWGIRIPVWYEVDGFEDKLTVGFLDDEGKYQAGVLADLLGNFSLPQIEKGLQTLSAASDVPYVLGSTKPAGENNKSYLPETDTFDTWFSSGQWPVVTLQTNQPNDFAKFYPTSVMETAYDILLFWVMRMMLLGKYLTGKSPFKTVYLHGLIRDSKGLKMSKSKGNVVNPLDIVEKYGADALRLALVIRSSPGQDKSVGDGDFKAARNFTNKIWNAARYVIEKIGDEKLEKAEKAKNLPADDSTKLTSETKLEYDAGFNERLNQVVKSTTSQMNKNQIGLAADNLYNEFWHWFCDECIEQHKQQKLSDKSLREGLKTFLKLLHPFVPFVTETIWQNLSSQNMVENKLLITAPWPKSD